MHTYGWKMTDCVIYSSFKTPWLKHFDSSALKLTIFVNTKKLLMEMC